MDEKQAVRRLKNGDIGALEFLVACHQVKAVRTAYLITRDLGLAEDIVQDCFLRAFHAIGGFDASRPFEPWFLRSVVHAAVKRLQRSARQVSVGEDADDFLLASLVAEAEAVETQVESMELQKQLWAAMEALSPRQRAVIVQRYYLEMSETEMASVSGAAIGTIKWLLHAARQRLRHLLVERSEE